MDDKYKAETLYTKKVSKVLLKINIENVSSIYGL